MFVRPDGGQLELLGALATAGRLRVEVSRELPLTEAGAAMELVARGHGRGKVVITVG